MSKPLTYDKSLVVLLVTYKWFQHIIISGFDILSSYFILFTVWIADIGQNISSLTILYLLFLISNMMPPIGFANHALLGFYLGQSDLLQD